jgi:hypothetical protein
MREEARSPWPSGGSRWLASGIVLVLAIVDVVAYGSMAESAALGRGVGMTPCCTRQ